MNADGIRDNRKPMLKRSSPLLLAVIAFVALVNPARAEDHARQIVPEIDAFIKLSDRARLFLLGDVSDNLTTNDIDGEVGVHLDFTLKPILRPYLGDANWARDRYLWLRIGYVRAGSIDGRANGVTENRLLLEATGRLELPGDVWLVNRGRVDFRDLDGQSSRRYRLRIGIERELTVGGVVLVPYAQAETFYDTRYDTWNRRHYQAGAEIELTKSWRIEPYLARQNDKRSPSSNLDILGLILKYYH